MFERLEEARGRKTSRFALISVGAHGLIVACVALLAFLNARAPEQKPVEVAFIGPGHGGGPPPPPPPPPGGKKHPHKVVHKVEIPKVVETPKPVPIEPKEVPKEEGVEGGKEGGVVGGVIGGVVGGVVGGNGGGGNVVPEPKEVKPKNVPAFVIDRDAINRPPPRMSEVFKTTHRGQTVKGSYKICVGLDGHITEVIPVAAIAGADDAMVEQIKEEWLYKPQKVPVCYLFNASITIE